MSLSVKTQGGTGGMTASIFVTGLIESDTVTASYGDKTKVAVWNSTESRHEITGIGDKGMWTITATNGVQTKTQDVLVDGAFEYEIEMGYKLWLYREGDECEDVTGGWVGTAGGYKYSGSSVNSATKNGDNMYFPRAKNYVLGTNQKIDITNYNTLWCERKVNSQNGDHPWVNVLVGGKDVAGSNRMFGLMTESAENERSFSSVDISSATGERYIAAALTSGNAEGYIYTVWLE